MQSDIQKQNRLRNLKEVLLDFMSKDEQRRFKESVPDVHVPIELMEELSDHARALQEV